MTDLLATYQNDFKNRPLHDPYKTHYMRTSIKYRCRKRIIH